MGYFCGYKQNNFQQLGFKYKDCYKQEIPSGMGSGGSWYNHQTKGTYTGFYDKDGYYMSDSGPAPSSDPYAHWGPVWSVWNYC